ncbi:MAG: 4Fe-4S dicluster domain-containing protein [Candidatus Bathyarchaeota archaeon]|jgi:Fe-S-cluster-containing dehydrogenase component|nr:4Fe-4S dicluster domain-containing protein [Candidatus Bathyarchaeota archaeon]
MSRNGKIWIKRNYEKCSGCRRCEIACTIHHEGKIWPEASRIRIFMIIPGVEIPHLCFQCTNYPCVEACPSGALQVDRNTGAVNVVASECTACGLCIKACPGNVPHLHPEENHIIICDLCDGTPKCVEVCREGRWNTLALVPREREAPHKTLAKTPQQLTREVARRILGARIAKEILD